MSTLKPCPFCGAAEPMVFAPTAKASDPYSPADRLYPTVRCRTCYAEAYGANGDSSCKTAIEKWNVRAAAQPAPVAGVVDDTRRIRALADNYWRLEPFAMPTPGGDDADVGWRVIEFHRAEPRERVVVEHYRDNPREAIDAAIATQHQEPPHDR